MPSVGANIFSGTIRQKLRGVIPFVQRLTLLHAVIALQADDTGAAARGPKPARLAGWLMLGLTLQQQRPLQLASARNRAVASRRSGEVALVPQRLHQGIDRGQGIHA